MEFINLTSLKDYLKQVELVEGAKKVWVYAENHMSTALRIGLIVYGALVIYSAFFLPSANPFAETGTIDQLQDYAFLLARLIICIIGLAGEFLGSRFCLKVFVVLVCIDGLTGIITVILSSPTGVLALNNRQTVEQMFASQKDYNWAPNSEVVDDDDTTKPKWKDVEQMKETTETWDNLQSGGCCGIDGYNDWNTLRPDGYPDASYPGSCCNNATVVLDTDPSVKLCDTTKIFEDGCRKLVEDAESNQMTMTFWIGVFEIGLAIIGYKVYGSDDPDQPSRDQMRNHYNLMRMQMQSPYNKPIKSSFKKSNDWSDNMGGRAMYGSLDGNDDKSYIISGREKFEP